MTAAQNTHPGLAGAACATQLILGHKVMQSSASSPHLSSWNQARGRLVGKQTKDKGMLGIQYLQRASPNQRYLTLVFDDEPATRSVDAKQQEPQGRRVRVRRI